MRRGRGTDLKRSLTPSVGRGLLLLNHGGGGGGGGGGGRGEVGARRSRRNGGETLQLLPDQETYQCSPLMNTQPKMNHTERQHMPGFVQRS